MSHNNRSEMRAEHERWLDLYVRALDEADWDALEAALKAAMSDAELEQLMLEVNRAYEEEAGLTGFARDADLVRELLREHLPSAFAPEETFAEPVTVGDVANYLSDKKRIPFADEAAHQILRKSQAHLPEFLSKQAINKLAADLGVTASERFWSLFRDTAIALRMGRSQQQVQLAARERRGKPKSGRRGKASADKKETSE